MEPSEPVNTNWTALPWIVLALVVVLAGVGLVWMNSRVETLQAAIAARHDSGSERAVAALEQTVKGIQSSQQDLVNRIADAERKVASEGSERKLMSEQLGGLSARVDALASANADSTGTARRQSPRARR